MKRGSIVVILALAAIAAGVYLAWESGAFPTAPAKSAAEPAALSRGVSSSAHVAALESPAARSLAKRVAAASVHPTLFNEYLGAKSYRALYDRLHGTAEGATAEGMYIQYDILRKCAVVTDRQYRRGVQAKPLDQRRADFAAALPPNDPNRDKRIAAFERSAVNRCAGFDDVQVSQADLDKMLADAAGAGDPKAKAAQVEQEIWAQRRAGQWRTATLSDAQVGTLEQAVGSRDPGAMMTAGQLLSNQWRNMTVQVGPDAQPVDPRAFYNAWQVVACEYGYPCGADNPHIADECANRGHCDATSLPDYISYYGSSPYESELLSQYESVLRGAIETGDWSQVTVSRGAATMPGAGMGAVRADALVAATHRGKSIVQIYRRALPAMLFYAMAMVSTVGIAAAAGRNPEPLEVRAKLDGPPVEINLKPAGRAARVEFSASAGERIDIGVRDLGFTPSSASSLLFTVLQPDGTTLPIAHRMRCHAVEAKAADCGSSFTVAASGKHALEIETPFSAEARFTLLMSRPVRIPLAADRPQTVNITRTGQSGLLELPLAEDRELSVSAHDVTPGGTRRAFALRVRRPDGSLVAAAAGDTLQPPSLSLSGHAGGYIVEIDPADGVTGTFEVSARANGAALAVDGSPAPFASSAPGEPVQLPFATLAGQRLSIVIEDLAQLPEAPADRMQAMTQNAGARVSVTALDGHLVQKRGCLSQKQFPGMDCKVPLEPIGVPGRYTVSIQPSAGVSVSGRIYVVQEAVSEIALPVSVHVGPLKPGQAVRYRFKASAGQSIGIDVAKISLAPEQARVNVTLQGPSAFPIKTLTWQQATAHFEPVALSQTGTYSIILDPGVGTIVSAELSIVPR